MSSDLSKLSSWFVLPTCFLSDWWWWWWFGYGHAMLTFPVFLKVLKIHLNGKNRRTVILKQTFFAKPENKKAKKVKIQRLQFKLNTVEIKETQAEAEPKCKTFYAQFKAWWFSNMERWRNICVGGNCLPCLWWSSDRCHSQVSCFTFHTDLTNAIQRQWDLEFRVISFVNAKLTSCSRAQWKTSAHFYKSIESEDCEQKWPSLFL